jgi:DNA excision repair protein ERCC-4
MIRIYADYREKNSGVPDLLKDLGVIVIFDNLSVADYVLSDEVGIERKNVSDLINSVFDKRFFDQLNRLSEAYKEPYLLVEGNLDRIKEITSRWKAINAALLSATVDLGIRVIYSSDKKDTAEILLKMAEKISKKTTHFAINLHEKPKFENLRDMQLYVIESFPNIGAKLAEKLLERFGSIENICKASVIELEKVIGSRKRAEDIYKIIHSKYSKENGENNKKKNNNQSSSVSLLDFLEPK